MAIAPHPKSFDDKLYLAMPLVLASLNTAGERRRNILLLSNLFLPLLFSLQSEKGKRWFTSGTWGKPSSQKVHPPGQWGKDLGGKLSLLTGFSVTFRSSLVAPKKGTHKVWGRFSGLDDFERLGRGWSARE